MKSWNFKITELLTFVSTDLMRSTEHTLQALYHLLKLRTDLSSYSEMSILDYRKFDENSKWRNQNGENEKKMLGKDGESSKKKNDGVKRYSVDDCVEKMGV